MGNIIEQHRKSLPGLDTTANLATYIDYVKCCIFIMMMYRLMYKGPPEKVISIKNKSGIYYKPFNKQRREIKPSDSIDRINRIVRSSDGNAFFVYEGKEYRILYAFVLDIEPESGLKKELPTTIDGNIFLKNFN